MKRKKNLRERAFNITFHHLGTDSVLFSPFDKATFEATKRKLETKKFVLASFFIMHSEGFLVKIQGVYVSRLPLMYMYGIVVSNILLVDTTNVITAIH